MNYLISEKELIELEYRINATNGPKRELSKWLKYFKSKQPLSLEGEGKFIMEATGFLTSRKIGDKWFPSLIDIYDGKNIKIYVEVSE